MANRFLMPIAIKLPVWLKKMEGGLRKRRKVVAKNGIAF
jgi:hypothetical protein